MTLVMAASMAVVAGAWMKDRVDAGMVFTAVWTGFWLLVSTGLFYGFQFVGPDDICTYPGCWPSPLQEVLVAVPVVVALIVMGVLGFRGEPKLARWRAVIPALVLLVLTAVQQFSWRTLVVPVLFGPPPW
ncbi:MAG: hypothetical protein QM779_11600 [Propionicimonas sp.]|uniref:hypothetical protein n=1 Tax=Propionicimonas sp. TaxID=1955623 RepID=UPI003D0F5225